MKLKSHIPIEVDIGEAEPLKLGVKRLSLEEKIRLRAKHSTAENANAEEKEDAWASLIIDTFRRYVRVEGELVIECDDGDITVKKGEDLLAYFGGSLVVLREIFLQVLLQSSLTDDQKKILRSHGDSSPSSEEPSPEAPGPKPETTATSAESSTSAGNGDAPSQEVPPSGSTDRKTEKQENPESSAMNARSLH